ncbi:hypothetical protein V1524DRAFT_411394 [Lipomyces starkeyi]
MLEIFHDKTRGASEPVKPFDSIHTLYSTIDQPYCPTLPADIKHRGDHIKFWFDPFDSLTDSRAQNAYPTASSAVTLARHHPADRATYTPVSVQVFYHRTTGQPQLSYVEVRQDEDESEAFCRVEQLRIPDDLDKPVGDQGNQVILKPDRFYTI